MRGYRQSLGRIAEALETSAADPDSHARKKPHNRIDSRPDVHFLDQVDGENSTPGERPPEAGLQNANTQAGIWTRRRVNLAYVGFVPYLYVD